VQLRRFAPAVRQLLVRRATSPGRRVRLHLRLDRVLLLLILSSRSAFTLPTIFRAFLGFQGAQYGEASALAVASSVPSIVCGMLVQGQLVRSSRRAAPRRWHSAELIRADRSANV
jgi:hypothetical protein